MAESERILLGRIVAAHGIRGDVLVKSYAGAPEAIGSYGPLATSDLARTFTLRVVRVTAKGVIARVAGVNDRNGAEAIAGTDLYVGRSQLPPAGEEEFYHTDLIGLSAVDPDGAEIGRIVGVYNFGAGDLLDVEFVGSRRTELIPFNNSFVPEIDLAGRRVVIVVPVTIEADAEENPPQA